MSERLLSTPELYKAGFDALLDRLGPDGTLRFLRLVSPGRGDYTKERQWLGSVSAEDIHREIVQNRQVG